MMWEELINFHRGTGITGGKSKKTEQCTGRPRIRAQQSSGIAFAARHIKD